MAGPTPRSLDPPSDDRGHTSGQLRTQHWTSAAEGEICWSLRSYRSVTVSLRRRSYEFTNVFVAIGLLVMMYPILCKVKYETLHQAFRHRALWIQIGFSIIMNWIVAPLLMVSQGALIPSDVKAISRILD